MSYLHGTHVLGAVAVPGDVGVDINAANKAVRGMKPMSRAGARALIRLAVAGLNAANAAAKADQGLFTPSIDGAVARRDDLARQLQNIDGSVAALTADPVPETAAEILREAVLKAIAEYNSVAEGSKTLAQARSKFYSDVVDNAKAMVAFVEKAASDLANKAKWYTSVTFYTVLAAGIVIAGGVSYGLYHRIKGSGR